MAPAVTPRPTGPTQMQPRTAPGRQPCPTLPQGERQGGFPADFGGQRPDGESPPGEEDGGSAYSLWLYLGCFTLLAAAFVPVLLCQRRRRFRP